MRTIWKFPLTMLGSFELPMPKGAVILSIQEQFGQIAMWAIVESDAPLETRTFIIRGTGHEMPPYDYTHISTFQMNDGLLVFHVFEMSRAVS